MKKRKGGAASNHMVGGLITFALFALFVVLSLLIVVIGVDGYREVVDRGERTGALRTSLGYVMGKLRSEAASDGVRLSEKEGVPMLVLTQFSDEGDPLETIIFHRDGALYETYQNASVMEFNPEYGTRIVDVEAFAVEQAAADLLSITATIETGESQTVHAALRVAGGGEAQ